MLERPAVKKQLRQSGGQESTAAVWAAVLGISTGEAWLRRDEPKSAATFERYKAVVTQLERGVPFAYATGAVGFRTLDLKIDPRALIPRPETEGLVDLVLKKTGMRDAGCEMRGAVADIGTGSGCIALSLAVEGCFEKIVAVERSAAAAALARENVQRIAPATPVEIREGNLLGPLVENTDRFRAIVSNPPYVTAAEYDELDASVREFEPRDALVGGSDGLDAIRALFAGSAALLEPAGLLALEIDERRAAAVRALGRDHGWRVEIHKDVFGCARYALSIRED